MDFYNQYDLRLSGRIKDQTAFELIEAIEQKFPVDSIQLQDGTKLWNLIRIFLYSNYQHIGEKAGSRAVNIETFRSFLVTLKEGFTPLRPPNNPIWGFSSGESRKDYQDTYYDIYLDPLYDILGDRLAVLEWPETSGIRRKYNKPVYSHTYLPMHIPLWTKTFWQLLIYQLRHRRTFRIQSEDTLKQVITYVSTTASINEQHLTNDLYDFITIFTYIKGYLSTFLEHQPPQAVLIRCGYGRFPQALAQACRQHHIPSIELQHGLITAYLPAYRRTTPTTNHDCIPEYLCAQGEAYANLVKTGNLFPPTHIKATGYPYLEKSLTQPTNKNILTKYSPYPQNLLVTSQWIVATEMQNFFLQVATILKEQHTDIGILFKPHPYDKNDYSHCQANDHFFLVKKYDDIFKLLPLVDLHSTVYSTSGLEAMAFGKPNIFIDINHYITNESPYITATPDDFVKKITTILQNYDTVSQEIKAVAALFFTPQPTTKFTHFFTDLNLLPNH